MNGVMDKTLIVDAATYGSHTVWRNTSVATGTNLSLPRVVGFEADSYMPTKPVGSYSLLAAQVFNIDGSKADANGENYNLTGNMNYGIVAQRFNNNVVVGFGTCQWQWSLIGVHDRTNTTPNVNARQMTLNLLTDLGAPPTTTASGLVTPTPQSLDNYGTIPAATPAPIAAYSFDAGTGSTVVDDTGNGHTGTLNGASAWMTSGGKTNASLTNGFGPVNGSGVSVPRAGLEPTTAFSVMGWVRAVGTYTYKSLISKSRAGLSDSWALYSAYDIAYRPHFDVTTTAGTVTCDAGSAWLSDNDWHHLAGTWDGSTARFYVDGVLVDSKSLSGTVVYDTSADVWLAGSHSWPGESLSGDADDIRIFDSALTASQVIAYKNTPQNASSLTKVTKTSASTWNVASTVNKFSASTWNVNQTVNDTNSVTWAVRTTVSKSYASAWAVRSVAAKTYAQTWNVRTTVTKSYSQLWNTAGALTTVSKTSSSTWNVQATVAPATNVNTWTVRSVVNKAAANSWTVREALSKASSSTWSVFSQVAASKASSWNVLSRITAKTYANSWTARAFVTDTNAVSWNARSLVTKTYQNLWDTEATGSVSSTYDNSWNVRTRVSKTYGQTWNIRTSLVTSKASTWNIRALATKSYLQAWNVRALTTKTSALTWDAYVAISKAANFTWAVRSSIGNIVDFSWRVRSLALAEAPVSWSVLELVTDQLPINWDILVLVGKSASNQWSINRQITRGYINNWNVGENSKWYVMTDDGPVLYRMVGVWDGTQVVAI
jgi:hypothetical protein